MDEIRYNLQIRYILPMTAYSYLYCSGVLGHSDQPGVTVPSSLVPYRDESVMTFYNS